MRPRIRPTRRPEGTCESSLSPLCVGTQRVEAADSLPTGCGPRLSRRREQAPRGVIHQSCASAVAGAAGAGASTTRVEATAPCKGDRRNHEQQADQALHSRTPLSWDTRWARCPISPPRPRHGEPTCAPDPSQGGRTRRGSLFRIRQFGRRWPVAGLPEEWRECGSRVPRRHSLSPFGLTGYPTKRARPCASRFPSRGHAW